MHTIHHVSTRIKVTTLPFTNEDWAVVYSKFRCVLHFHLILNSIKVSVVECNIDQNMIELLCVDKIIQHFQMFFLDKSVLHSSLMLLVYIATCQLVLKQVDRYTLFFSVQTDFL